MLMTIQLQRFVFVVTLFVSELVTNYNRCLVLMRGPEKNIHPWNNKISKLERGNGANDKL
jgi:hypothetical protein